MNGATLLTDTTDATGRCHDPGGGGIEIVDATQRAQSPREVHLVRFPGFTHTNTVDGKRPGSSTAAPPTSPTATGSTS